MPRYIGDIYPSPSSESSTSREDDVSKNEEEILVSVDRPDDPTEEGSHGDEVEEHEPVPLDKRDPLQVVISVVIR